MIDLSEIRIGNIVIDKFMMFKKERYENKQIFEYATHFIVIDIVHLKVDNEFKPIPISEKIFW
jgi:hypothetical protein